MLIISNKNIYLNYFLIKSFIAGLALKGWEVKYIKLKKFLEIKNSFILIKNKEFFIKNIFTKKVKHETNRNIKLLLNKKEILEIIFKIKEKNYSILPISMFIDNKFIKTELALVFKKKNMYKKNKIC